MSDALDLAKKLISKPSLTPNDAGCQTLLEETLSPLGFKIEHLRFGNVDNLWAKIGNTPPLLVFAGHTDVVPTGPLEAWNSDPFTPTIQDGYLYGRGVADMKGGVAAMVSAARIFLEQKKSLKGSIAFLLTSDEEGEAQDGTKKVVEWLQERGEKIDYCIVGEPSTHQTLGDTIRVGRRGSLTCHLTLLGKQGHTAFPDKANNPVHRSLSFLQRLVSLDWGKSRDPFPPTSLQISNVHAGTGASNVIPGELFIDFNCRFSPHLTVEAIQQKIKSLLEEYQLNYRIHWLTPSLPFLTKPSKLTEAVVQTIQNELNIIPNLSTGGGTSDGRFIATTGAEVIELGLCNATIHQVNERVSIDELLKLEKLYVQILFAVVATTTTGKGKEPNNPSLTP